jgi:hypothetical protein
MLRSRHLRGGVKGARRTLKRRLEVECAKKRYCKVLLVPYCKSPFHLAVPVHIANLNAPVPLSFYREQRRIIDEQRSIINQLRNQPSMVTPTNVPLGIPDSVFHQLNASYLALGLAGGDDQLRAIDDSMSGQPAPLMQQAPDPLLSRGRRLASNSDIRARSRSGVRQMGAIQESPGEGPQG